MTKATYTIQITCEEEGYYPDEVIRLEVTHLPGGVLCVSGDQAMKEPVADLGLSGDSLIRGIDAALHARYTPVHAPITTPVEGRHEAIAVAVRAAMEGLV